MMSGSEPVPKDGVLAVFLGGAEESVILYKPML